MDRDKSKGRAWAPNWSTQVFPGIFHTGGKEVSLLGLQVENIRLRLLVAIFHVTQGE